MSETVKQTDELRFEDLGLTESSLSAITRKGFEKPTRIQAEVIPRLLSGNCDIIAQSHTGTGKTAAFGLPLIQSLEPKKGIVQALILVPTRELAVQVAEEINSLRGSKPLHVVPIYGGQSYELQFRHLRQGVDILVGTPGRIIDHLNRGSLKLADVSWAVLDEADEMLDMGFIEDIEAILGMCSGPKRMLLFSATMPHRIRSMAETWMKNIEEVSVRTSALTTAQTEQTYMEVLEQDKFEALCRIVDHSTDFYGIVFGRTKVECDNIQRRLVERAYDAEVLHGDINQSGREKVLDAFRKKHIDILVATDVAARGIDVEGLTHVINFSLPTDSESYVHRIGRTGRAGREGRAVTFVTPSEFRKLSMIQRVAKNEIKRERPPRVEEILELKRLRIAEELKAAILKQVPAEDSESGTVATSPIDDIFVTLAEEISSYGREQGLDFAQVLSAVLRTQLASDLDPSRYGKVTELQPGGQNRGDRYDRGDRGDRFDRGGDRGDRGPRERQPVNGEIRLYVARGKVDNFTKPMLVDFIKKGSGVWERNINGVELYEYYSFITVSPEDAGRITSAFSQGGKDGKPIVRPAEPEGPRERKPSGFRKPPSGQGKSYGPRKHERRDGKPGSRGPERY